MVTGTTEFRSGDKGLAAASPEIPATEDAREPRFSCEGLSCARGGKRLFSGLGFTLEPGSLLILRGANGSGKSSLLSTLAGLSPPAQGCITWNQESIKNNGEFQRALCFIGHKNALKPEETVEESLSFWARAYGREELAAVALRYFGLERRRDMPCARLSAGWQRRVALSRLVLSPASLWLLDEPGNFLDAEAGALFWALVESRVRAGGMVVIASHASAHPPGARVLDIGDFRV